MTSFMKLNARTEMRLGEYAMRLLQVEAHLRRGERRAATARLDGLADELEGFRRESEFPLPMVLIGAQLGLLSGPGPLVRGKLAGAALGGVAGWFVGQALTASHRRYLEEIRERVEIIERSLEAEAAPDHGDQATSQATSPPNTP